MAVNEQTQKDTERAKGRLAQNLATPRNEQTQKDTDKANAQTDKDSAPSPSTMDQREAAAGLNLAGNDPMSGRRGGMSMPSMSEREAAAGLNLAGNDTMSGRSDSFYDYDREDPPPPPSQQVQIYADEGGVIAAGGSFKGIICINGEPYSAIIKGSIGSKITTT